MVFASGGSLERRAEFCRNAERPRTAPGDVVAGKVVYRPRMPVTQPVLAKLRSARHWRCLFMPKHRRTFWLANSVDVKHREAESIHPCSNRPFINFTSHETVGGPSRDCYAETAREDSRSPSTAKDSWRFTSPGAAQGLHQGRSRCRRGAGGRHPAVGGRRGAGRGLP